MSFYNYKLGYIDSSGVKIGHADEYVVTLNNNDPNTVLPIVNNDNDNANVKLMNYVINVLDLILQITKLTDKYKLDVNINVINNMYDLKPTVDQYNFVLRSLYKIQADFAHTLNVMFKTDIMIPVYIDLHLDSYLFSVSTVDLINNIVKEIVKELDSNIQHTIKHIMNSVVLLNRFYA